MEGNKTMKEALDRFFKHLEFTGRGYFHISQEEAQKLSEAYDIWLGLQMSKIIGPSNSVGGQSESPSFISSGVKDLASCGNISLLVFEDGRFLMRHQFSDGQIHVYPIICPADGLPVSGTLLTDSFSVKLEVKFTALVGEIRTEEPGKEEIEFDPVCECGHVASEHVCNNCGCGGCEIDTEQMRKQMRADVKKEYFAEAYGRPGVLTELKADLKDEQFYKERLLQLKTEDRVLAWAKEIQERLDALKAKKEFDAEETENKVAAEMSEDAKADDGIVLEEFNAGLLPSPAGNADTDWWQSVIRTLLEEVHNFYQAQVTK